MEIRLAKGNEADICYSCIEDARAYHKSLGFEQWHPGYPSYDTITDDIAQGIGYVFTEEDRILGYCCLTFEEEPAYKEIDGAWKTTLPYAVVHRMSFAATARSGGLSAEAFRLIRECCKAHDIKAIRVDTQEENKVMQHVLAREGFVYCGTVTFDNGPKLAYEWDAE